MQTNFFAWPEDIQLVSTYDSFQRRDRALFNTLGGVYNRFKAADGTVIVMTYRKDYRNGKGFYWASKWKPVADNAPTTYTHVLTDALCFANRRAKCVNLMDEWIAEHGGYADE